MLPTFLGIGAQRSGTTWMYEQLRLHPEIWLTPVKEVHYFDKRDHLSLLANKHYRKHLHRRLYTYLQVFTELKLTNLHYISWDLNYFLNKRDTRWYVSIFRPGPGQIAGEITPAYMTLDIDVVKEIRQLNPAMKIIFLMRDPIERAWSGAVKSLARDQKRKITDISDEDFMHYFERKGAILRGDYINALDIWENVFGPHQIHIDFMDEIQKKPEDVIRRLYRFLEVSDNENLIPKNLKRKVNSTDGYKTAIPERFESYLAQRYLAQLEILNKRFGGHTKTWLQHAKRRIVEKNPSNCLSRNTE